MTEEEQAQKYVMQYADKINATPVLLSILYDANLMPEQVTTKVQAIALAAVVVAYDAGVTKGAFAGEHL